MPRTGALAAATASCPLICLSDADADPSFAASITLTCAATSSTTSAQGALAGINAASGAFTNFLEAYRSAGRPVMRTT